MQPTRQGRAVSKLSGILSQRGEDGLRDILGSVGLANHAEGGGIDQINIALNESGKRGF
jgi:hypothetical protein